MHLVDRQVGQYDWQRQPLENGDKASVRWVDALQIDDRLMQSWQEAVEREEVLTPCSLETASRRHAFIREKNLRLEPRLNRAERRRWRGEPQAAGHRRQSGHWMVQRLEEGLYKVRVQVENRTAFDPCASTRDER